MLLLVVRRWSLAFLVCRLRFGHRLQVAINIMGSDWLRASIKHRKSNSWAAKKVTRDYKEIMNLSLASRLEAVYFQSLRIFPQMKKNKDLWLNKHLQANLYLIFHYLMTAWFASFHVRAMKLANFDSTVICSGHEQSIHTCNVMSNGYLYTSATPPDFMYIRDTTCRCLNRFPLQHLKLSIGKLYSGAVLWFSNLFLQLPSFAIPTF